MTEAFCHLCRHLLEHVPAAGVILLRLLSKEFFQLTPEEAGQVTIITQVTTDQGRPDIVIQTPEQLAYIEVKCDSDLGYIQLERYRLALDAQSDYEQKKLILLSRYAVAIAENGEHPDYACRWFEIADWLEKLSTTDEVSAYLVRQFLDFLCERNISLQKVEWNLVDGSKALRNLLNLLDEAIKHEGIKIHRATAGWDWIGFYLDKKKSFVGFYFDEPNQLRFEAYYDEILSAKHLDKGEAYEKQWNNRLSLTAEDTYFFAREKSSQLKLICEFLKNSYEYSEGLRNQ